MSNVRDFAAEQRAAIEEALAASKAAGTDTSHLESLLKGKGDKEADAGGVRVGPGGSQPEPADGSAPDKRDQDNSPKVEVVDGVEVVVGPKDPGPEAKAGKLPDQKADPTPKKQPAPGTLPDQANPEYKEPEPVDQEKLQKEAAAKDRRRDKAEAENKTAEPLENKAQPRSAAPKRPAADGGSGNK